MHDGEEFGRQPVSEFWLKMPRERQPRQWKKTQVLPKRTNQLHKDVVEDVDASLAGSALHG